MSLKMEENQEYEPIILSELKMYNYIADLSMQLYFILLIACNSICFYVFAAICFNCCRSNSN